MLDEVLLPSLDDFDVKDVTVDQEIINLRIGLRTTGATCPCCGRSSDRVHSQYGRTIADLPCAGRSVRLRVTVRRFFCDNGMCERRTFAERVPSLAAQYARRTIRLAARQRQASLALGGEAGARLLRQLGMPTSGDTLLRLLRDNPREAAPPPHILGIDDWAWCRGQRYGTILVDLERHIPVDLLPDRSADSLAAWLRDHPGIEIISRDRSLEYAKGIAQGAPNAVEVADRWHLLQNLKDALIRILEQHTGCLYAAASQPESDRLLASIRARDTPQEMAAPPLSVPTKAAQRRQATRDRRLARYQAVMDLHQQGVKIRSIAHQLRMGRATVRRYTKAGGFPEMGTRKRGPTILDPFLPHLEKRWSEGCQNGLQLFREIQKQGYSGSRPSVSRWACKMRQVEAKAGTHTGAPAKAKSRAVRPWSPRHAVWLLLHRPEDLSAGKRAALDRMLVASSSLRQAHELAQGFIRIVRQRLTTELEPWLQAVIKNRIPELSGFARSMEKDKKAVLTALVLPWSNGQVEAR
jgi:transposase